MKKIGALLLVMAALAFGVLMQERAKASDEETQLIQLERAWNRLRQVLTLQPLLACLRTLSST